MDKIIKAIKAINKEKQEYAVGELFVKVSAQLDDKISMKEFVAAYNEVQHERK